LFVPHTHDPHDSIDDALDLIKVSLSLAMGLTTILTTFRFVHQNPPQWEITISKENWTSEDLCGRAADIWGSGVTSSCLSRSRRDDLAHD
ncbi:MAG: hypothetical protein ACRDPL_20400, partial [Propionibacteriaceae bacterium]